jgi:mannose-6-phosphate isomerase-like protein (cupin superfamily)
MKPKFVPKKWGHEIWFANVDEGQLNYCGKKLFIKHDIWSSEGAYHYHKVKDETFYIVDGYLQLDWVDSYVDTDHFRTEILGPGDSFRVKPYVKHRFTSASIDGCTFIEASTFHSDDDSYRVIWNEEKEVWDEISSASVDKS